MTDTPTIKNTNDLLALYANEIEESIKVNNTLPPAEVLGRSLTGRKLWRVLLRSHDLTDSKERALSILEAAQLYCFAPSVFYLSFFFHFPTDDGHTVVVTVSDSDKIKGYFAKVIVNEDGKLELSKANEKHDEISIKQFDSDLFGALGGIIKFDSTPIDDIKSMVTILENRGHKFEMLDEEVGLSS